MLLLLSVIAIIIGCFNLNNNSVKTNWAPVALVYLFIVLSWGMTYIDVPDIPGYITYFYQEVYDWLEDGYKLGSHNNFESGFLWLSGFAKTVSHKFYIFQLILFSIEILLIMIGLNKLLGCNKMIAVICSLFFVLPFNLLGALRQGVAIALFIFALQFIKNRKFFYYCITLLIASLFHTSALLLIFFYWVPGFSRFLQKRAIAVALLIILNICYFTNISVSSIIEPLLINISGSFHVMNFYSVYTEALNGAVQSNFGILKIVEMDLVYVIFILLNKDEDRTIQIFKSFFLFYFILNYLLGGIIAHRLSYYFTLTYYISFVIAIVWFTKKYLNSKGLGYIIFCSYLAVLYQFVFYSNASPNNYKNMFIEDVVYQQSIV